MTNDRLAKDTDMKGNYINLEDIGHESVLGGQC